MIAGIIAYVNTADKSDFVNKVIRPRLDPEGDRESGPLPGNSQEAIIIGFFINPGTDSLKEQLDGPTSRSNWTRVQLLLEGGPYSPLRITLMANSNNEDPLMECSGSAHVRPCTKTKIFDRY